MSFDFPPLSQEPAQSVNQGLAVYERCLNKVLTRIFLGQREDAVGNTSKEARRWHPEAKEPRVPHRKELGK